MNFQNKEKSWNDFSFFFRFPHKNWGSNEIRRENYTYHDAFIERMFFTMTWENIVRQPWNIFWNKLLYSAFQFHIVLLKSITDPFIFPKVINVEKMEIQWANNWIKGKKIIYIETNCSDPNKKHNLFERDFDDVLFFVSCAFFITLCKNT